MAGFVDALEVDILEFWAIATTWTVVANHYYALSTTTPTDAGTNFTEPAGSGYLRVTHARNGTNYNTAAGGAPTTLTNATVIQWPQASGSWGTVTHVGIYDADTVGNLQWWAALDTPKAVTSGDQPQIAASGLTFQLGDPGDSY